MPKAVLLITPVNFNDTEFSVTRKGLEDGGISVTVSSVTSAEAISMKGVRVKPDKELRQIDPDEYDALIIIGGSGTPKLLEYPEVMDKIRKFNERGKLIGAICLAPILLARSGILKGVVSTVFPTDFSISLLKQGGATYSRIHVVEDENIITADGPDSAKEFVDKILKKLNV